MNAQELYEHIKDTLNYMGLRFNQMDQVRVTIVGYNLVLSHGDIHVWKEFEEPKGNQENG